MKVIVGSNNPVKIDSVKTAFASYFDNVQVIGYSVPSGVADQPFADDTFKGAENRAEALLQLNNDKIISGDYFVGIEGGVLKEFNHWMAFGCMCIIDKKGNKSFGTSAHFELPAEVSAELLNGSELGDVMDGIMNKKNTKQKSGAIGYFTKGIMDRKELYLHGMISALIPFLHAELYF